MTDYFAPYAADGDFMSINKEPFTPSAGDLWHSPKVFVS